MRRDSIYHLDELVGYHADLTAYLDRRTAMRLALRTLLSGIEGVGWVADVGPDAVLRLDALEGDRSGALRGLVVPEGLGLTGKVLGAGRSDWVDDYTRSDTITHTYDAHIEQEGIKRLLAAPLIWNNRVLGVIALGSREDGTFGDRFIQRLERVAEQTALAESIADRVDLAKKLAVQDERTRLSADLHDSVGALLYAIGSRVEGIARMAGSADPELARQIDTLRGHAAEASSALRESLRMLRTSPVGLDVVVALDGDRTAFSKRTGIPAELVVVDDPPDLSPSRAEVVVEGVREALLNVEKHARATAVVVTVATEPGRLTVAVTDDGVGVTGHVRNGIGLTKTDEAVRRLGGTLDLLSDAPEDGATWRIRLPL